MKPLSAVSLLAVLLLSRLFAAETAQTVLVGKVVSVSDGDTVTILTDAKEQVKIRLEGIDAPESGQDFGTKSKQALSERVFGKQVRCVKTGEDRYGRTLASVYLEDRWINQEMVEAGFAWHFTKYSSDKRLAEAQAKARTYKSGLWQKPIVIPPWEYRKPTTDSTVQAAVFVTKTGTKYHRGTCHHLAKSKIVISLEDARRQYTPCQTCKPPQ